LNGLPGVIGIDPQYQPATPEVRNGTVKGVQTTSVSFLAAVHAGAFARPRNVSPAGLISLLGLGQVLTAKGNVSAAEPMLREALAIRQKSMPAGHWQVAEGESALGWCFGRMNREEEARPLVAAALDTLSRQLGSSHRLTRTALRRLAEIREPR
jgi:Tetratricopeptide repeat